MFHDQGRKLAFLDLFFRFWVIFGLQEMQIGYLLDYRNRRLLTNLTLLLDSLSLIFICGTNANLIHVLVNSGINNLLNSITEQSELPLAMMLDLPIFSDGPGHRVNQLLIQQLR